MLPLLLLPPPPAPGLCTPFSARRTAGPSIGTLVAARLLRSRPRVAGAKAPPVHLVAVVQPDLPLEAEFLGRLLHCLFVPECGAPAADDRPRGGES